MLAWPCNQFGGQEPRPAAAVAEWARREYKASFPILSKVDVNGPKADPVGVAQAGEACIRAGGLARRRHQVEFR